MPAETITLLPSLGVQLSHKRDLALFPLTVDSHQHLVPLERIARVVLNEGLQGAGAKAYLAVVENGQGERGEGEKVHVVFPVRSRASSSHSPSPLPHTFSLQSILPRLKDLEPVLQKVRAVLKQ